MASAEPGERHRFEKVLDEWVNRENHNPLPWEDKKHDKREPREGKAVFPPRKTLKSGQEKIPVDAFSWEGFLNDVFLQIQNVRVLFKHLHGRNTKAQDQG